MKNLIYLLSFLLLTSCIENNKYTLTGSFNGDQNEEWIYMVKIPGDYSTRDSAKIKNGTFKFEGIVEYPEMYALHYQMEKITGLAMLILEPADIKIAINLDNWDMDSKVSGGKLNEEFYEFKAIQFKEYVQPDWELRSKLREAEPQKKELLKDSIKRLMDEHYNFQTDFINNHPESPASYYLMFALRNNIPLEEKGKMLANAHPDLHKTILYKRLQKDYETQVAVNENPKGINYQNEAHLMNVDFVNDSIIKTLVKNNSGKVLYIDIWATWCGPCKEEFPHSKKLFSELNPEKLQMIYFCINSQEENWKKTIVEQELPGQHYLIGDETFDKFKSNYNIKMKGVPHYIIVGKDGKIEYKDAPRPSSDETLKILANLIE
jgi:thiol-disulfide isomerase/thioredoxin